MQIENRLIMQRKINYYPLWIAITLVLILAATIRFGLIFFYPQEAGDGWVYTTLAGNMISGCGFSLSHLGSGHCVPAIGGYFPGYPAFIAINWSLFGAADKVIHNSQSVIYLIALSWLIVSLARQTKSVLIAAIIGGILAISPLQVGWFRFTLTEPLSLAAATWLMAELINSWTYRRLLVVPLVLAFSSAIYIRPDSVFLIFAIAIVAVGIHGARLGVKKLLLFLVITTIPVGAWMVRNYTIEGVAIKMAVDYAPAAPGYSGWVNTWVTSEHDRASAIFPLWKKDYSQIQISNNLVPMDNFNQVNSLLQELARHDGQEMPKQIDAAFAKLADDNRAKMSFQDWWVIYLKRSVQLLLNPASSWGLPSELGRATVAAVKSALDAHDFNALVSLAKENYGSLLIKFAGFGYRILLFSAFLLVLAKIVRDRLYKAKSVVWNDTSTHAMATLLVIAVSISFVARLLFFSVLGGLEARYLVPIIPMVECAVGLYVFSMMWKMDAAGIKS